MICRLLVRFDTVVRRAYGNRTRDSSVKGRCLNPLTNAPFCFWECKNRAVTFTGKFFSVSASKKIFNTSFPAVFCYTNITGTTCIQYPTFARTFYRNKKKDSL
jgi:hypothetical protein